MPTSRDTTGDLHGLDSFHDCHRGILDYLRQLHALAELVRQPGKERDVEELALAIWRFFREVIVAHHEEEEEELFPAMLKAWDQERVARDDIKSSIERLTREHRDVEQIWERIEPQIRKLSRGKLAILDVAAVNALCEQYEAHARFEEDHFLPLCEQLLGSQSVEMRKLARAIHARRPGTWVAGYV